MRYLDSGSRDPLQAVGAWLQAELTTDVVELRWQSGYFVSDALGLFVSTLQRLAAGNQRVRVLIGSNESATLWTDVLQLVGLLGIPRSNAELGVVRYANSLFHPKTYHFRRTDGTQCAYVGSSNLTEPGISGLNIEGGIILDSRSGDPDDVLNQIAAAIDAWFTENRGGLHRISNSVDVERLRDDGVLAVAPSPRTPAPPGAARPGGVGAPLPPRLRPLFRVPRFRGAPGLTRPPRRTAPAPVTVTQSGFPAHMLFAPNATEPTIGVQAVSGRGLPTGMVGAIIRLSGDTTRIFAAQVGTANLSLPTGTIVTLRFGQQGGQGRYPNRPRAEFELMVRYVGRTTTIALPGPLATNVMAYGYLPHEPGHKDVRMLIPAPVRRLTSELQRGGLLPPKDGDIAFLEWATAADPTFRLSFLEAGSPLAQHAQQLFTAAVIGQQLLGDNACGLPGGISPAW